MTIVRSSWHHGLYLQLARGEQRVLINPKKPYNGFEAKTNDHDFGETNVPDDFWQSWLKEVKDNPGHSGHELIANGVIWEKGKRHNTGSNMSGAAVPDANIQQQRPLSGLGRGKNPLYGG
jgi:hypothetical protein